MTRTEAIKEFFKKAVLPVAIAGLLYCIFKSACIRNGELDLSNPPASGMESWIFSGSGYSAACPSASIGCASGSCRAAAPWAAVPRCSC